MGGIGMPEEERKSLIKQYGINLTGYDYQRNMMFTLPIALKTKVVVETGLAMGDSTRIFLKALKLINGHLFTYDNVDYPNTRKSLETEGLTTNWTFRQMDSVEGAYKWTDGEIDFLYLDSDHFKKHVLAELNAWNKHLSPTAIVLIHDTNHPDPHPRSCEGLEAAAEWIKTSSGWKLVNLNDPLGMAMLWKD
jgi:cephalosporin hydroxylase